MLNAFCEPGIAWRQPAHDPLHMETSGGERMSESKFVIQRQRFSDEAQRCGVASLAIPHRSGGQQAKMMSAKRTDRLSPDALELRRPHRKRHARRDAGADVVLHLKRRVFRNLKPLRPDAAARGLHFELNDDPVARAIAA
jgi:hypothetical protein